MVGQLCPSFGLPAETAKQKRVRDDVFTLLRVCLCFVVCSTVEVLPFNGPISNSDRWERLLEEIVSGLWVAGRAVSGRTPCFLSVVSS